MAKIVGEFLESFSVQYVPGHCRLATSADACANAERRVLVAGTDDDAALDWKVIEHAAHRRRSVVLGRLLVGTAEPARCSQRSPFGHPNVLLAEAKPGSRRARCLGGYDWLFDRFGH